ncbi:MAG: acetamidase/formamidase family protein [Candidatus Bathyarchaeia archaeon]
MKSVSFSDVGLKYVLSPYDEPIVHVKPGEVLLLEVEDASSGQIRNRGDSRDRSKIPFGNPVVGPIYIEGAEKGSTISVSIDEIKPTIGQGATYFSEFNEVYVAGTPILRFMGVSFPREPRICKMKDGQIYFSDDIVIPYQPMIGTIGVAPYPEEESFSSGVLPGRHGGNMDLPDIGPGSTVFLPVFHKGALLYVGDAHAVQGDGEISGTAVEMPAEVKIKMDLLEGEPINWPRIETGSEVMCVETTRGGRSLEDAIRTAFLDLITWMEEKHGLNRFEGLMLCSQVGKIRIGNLWTVAAKIEKKYLEAIRS